MLPRVRSGILSTLLRSWKAARSSRLLAAAKTWIERLDLTTLDVRQLKGVGPLCEAESQQLLTNPQFIDQIRRPPITDASYSLRRAGQTAVRFRGDVPPKVSHSHHVFMSSRNFDSEIAIWDCHSAFAMKSDHPQRESRQSNVI